MLRAIAFIAVPAIFLSMASPPCLAGEQDTKPATTPATPKKPEMKSRGLHNNERRPGSLGPRGCASVFAPKGDSGGAEDTIGGLPGHSSGPAQDKQP